MDYLPLADDAATSSWNMTRKLTMLQITPDLDWSEPPMDIIVTAAEHIFDISRFYDDDDDPEGPDQDDSDDGSDSDSESSSEDS